MEAWQRIVGCSNSPHPLRTPAIQNEIACQYSISYNSLCYRRLQTKLNSQHLDVCHVKQGQIRENK
jgi:hypothetical protein